MIQMLLPGLPYPSPASGERPTGASRRTMLNGAPNDVSRGNTT
jgi:hypothetical protein